MIHTEDLIHFQLVDEDLENNETNNMIRKRNSNGSYETKKLASWNDLVVLVEFCENIETFWNVTFSNILFSWMNNIFFFVTK